MRTILQSETYQRSPATLTANAFDHRFYSHSYPRRLKAEVMLDAFSQVTDVPTTFKGQPIGMRATQLPDANIASYFLDTFGRPERVLTCACERSNDPSMTQACHLTNGPTIQEKLESQEGRIPRFIESNTSPEEIIRTTYLAAFSRLPTDNETLQLLAVFEKPRPSKSDKSWRTSSGVFSLRGSSSFSIDWRSRQKNIFISDSNRVTVCGYFFGAD